MGFWQGFPGPTWFHFFSSAAAGADREPIRTSLPAPDTQPACPGVIFRRMKPEKENEYRNFLMEHYRMAIFSYYVMPKWNTNWIGIEARTLDGELVGTVISEGGGEGGDPKPAVIDMYCVATPYRKCGVGSRLLWEIDRETAQAGRLTHIFMKEGAALWWLPPLRQGRWVFRWISAPALALAPSSKVKIRDTCWKTIPLGQLIGEICWIAKETTQEEIDTAADQSGFKIVLATEKMCPCWEKDAPFFWYAYNWIGSTSRKWALPFEPIDERQ